MTYYRERYTTDLQDVTRTYQVPVTQYVYEPYLSNRWNPFAQPTLNYRMVPKTSWETKVETVKIPVSRRDVVPETVTQQVPVTTHKVAEDKVVSRVAVGTTSSTAGTLAANPSSRPAALRSTPRTPPTWAAIRPAACRSSIPASPSRIPIGGRVTRCCGAKASPRNGRADQRNFNAVNSRTRPSMAGSTGSRSIELAP